MQLTTPLASSLPTSTSSAKRTATLAFQALRCRWMKKNPLSVLLPETSVRIGVLHDAEAALESELKHHVNMCSAAKLFAGACRKKHAVLAAVATHKLCLRACPRDETKIERKIEDLAMGLVHAAQILAQKTALASQTRSKIEKIVRAREHLERVEQRGFLCGRGASSGAAAASAATPATTSEAANASSSSASVSTTKRRQSAGGGRAQPQRRRVEGPTEPTQVSNSNILTGPAPQPSLALQARQQQAQTRQAHRPRATPAQLAGVAAAIALTRAVVEYEHDCVNGAGALVQALRANGWVLLFENTMEGGGAGVGLTASGLVKIIDPCQSTVCPGGAQWRSLRQIVEAFKATRAQWRVARMR